MIHIHFYRLIHRDWVIYDSGKVICERTKTRCRCGAVMTRIQGYEA